MNAEEMGRALADIADQIVADIPSPAGVMVLGIQTRGAVLGRRLRELLEARYKAGIGSGFLDITLYRDDLSALGPQPDVHDSEIPFDVRGAKIILVDDVLFTGRTIRAALDEIVEFGRPALIRLAVLVDRGLREYPIQPDYMGVKLTTEPNQTVRVQVAELEQEDCVQLVTRKG
jgi:pyrimidine operon attenuation protein/uracil phosphoribosyltransferase